MAGGPRLRVLISDARQLLKDYSRGQEPRNAEIAVLMTRVLDLMVELMTVRAALQAAGPTSVVDVRIAREALVSAGRVLRRVSRQLSIG